MRLLNDRYRLVRRLNRTAESGRGSETWEARDEDETSFLLKAWPTGAEPNLVLRALWDRELRVLYRASSSAGADACLLVVREAQFDRQIGAFVLVSEGPGYDTLVSALGDRRSSAWLMTSTLKQRDRRALLWKGLRRVAAAIRTLHEQQIMHRAVGPESIYLDLEDGPPSMRLGSYEWSVRLGSPAEQAPAGNWSTPPEVLADKGGYTFDTDWYGFGMVAARCLVAAEGWRDLEPESRRKRVFEELGSSSILTGKERDLVRRLIDRDPRARLTYAEEIMRQMDELIIGLAVPQGGNESRPLNLVIAATNTKLIEALIGVGYVPDPAKPDASYSPRDPAHIGSLREFVRTDLQGGLVYGLSQPDRCVVRGKRSSLLLRPYRADPQDEASWDFAHVSHAVSLSADETNFRPLQLGSTEINVMTPREVGGARAKGVRSWEAFIPRAEEASTLSNALVRFQDFLRCTSQLDLLMRDAEVTAYEVVSQKITEGHRQVVEIRERARPRAVLAFCRVDGGMVEILQREIDMRKPNWRRVILTKDDALQIQIDPAKDYWEIETDFDMANGTVRLSRTVMEGQAPLAKQGFLRTYGHYAAVTLVRRRTEAIDRLQEHSYVLRALAQPGQVYMDTQITELPDVLDPMAVDESKTAAIRDSLRVRPMYALQGPPGTGKTTLVAHLLRQILADDPVAQILVTAQAHAAVDVLRRKVREEVFGNTPEEELPLAVRLGKGEKDERPQDVEGSVANVTADLLRRVSAKLEQSTVQSALQRRWHALAQQLVQLTNGTSAPEQEGRSDQAERDLADFAELVRRSASITYCTTSARDLEDLADSNRSFDWSIVEEAGRSHGFDLALPLQVGHRWLLLGDQAQLPPYRINDYAAGIEQLGQVVEALSDLTSQQLVDRDWVGRWSRQSVQDQADFQEFCKTWLRTFGTLFNQLKDGIFGTERMTLREPVGAATGRLSIQYRMHPTIGTLISKAFYPEFGGIDNGTVGVDGKPLPRILHSIESPVDLRGKAILWIDTPWCQQDPKAGELGPKQKKPRFENPLEADIVVRFLDAIRQTPGEKGDVAVLAPYTAQVRLLNRKLERVAAAGGLRFRQSIQRQPNESADERWAHTVDSFQGNEADIVVVSMVRNNTELPGKGLGFMADDASRFNVLLSRAQKLLVIVGSWDFFARQLEHVPRDNRFHELWAMRTALDEIALATKEGRAARISASEFAKLVGEANVK
ncbi:AAA domain-containing protein [Ralstonia syzygii]|uniref:AAA domain-containing protein n=1 Tax=Ralstonia syzygii TaxID=28097 RepID=UPI0036F2B490